MRRIPKEGHDRVCCVEELAQQTFAGYSRAPMSHGLGHSLTLPVRVPVLRSLLEMDDFFLIGS